MATASTPTVMPLLTGLATPWRMTTPGEKWSKRNIHGDLLLIIRADRDKGRPYHCYCARFMGKRRGFGQAHYLDRCRTVEQALDVFDRRRAG